MSLISGYDNDVFISYHYLDNQPIVDGEKGWVDILHEGLEIRVAQFLGERPKIWRHLNLIGGQHLDSLHRLSLSKSAILICILSPAYTISEWCLNELREFYNRSGQKADIVIDDRSRIFKVLKTPVPYASHPSELKDFVGYEFYDVDQASGRAREYDTRPRHNRELRYWVKLDDLAFDLADMIMRMQQRQSHKDQSPIQTSPSSVYEIATEPEVSRPTAPSSVYEIATEPEVSRPLRVFLCHSSSDKPAVRDLYHRLRDDGIDPWLDEENLLPGQNWEREIPKAVRNCDVVLICLSQSSVNKKGYVQKEIRFALDVADEQPEDTIFLIPLLLEDCDVPERIRSYQWVNIYEESGYGKLMRSLRACSSNLSVTGRTAS